MNVTVYFILNLINLFERVDTRQIYTNFDTGINSQISDLRGWFLDADPIHNHLIITGSHLFSTNGLMLVFFSLRFI
jgi:hypothetical protein